MARIDLTYNIPGTPPDDLPTTVNMIVNSLMDQYNSAPQIFPVPNGQALPTGMVAGDVVVSQDNSGNASFGLFNGQAVQTLSQDSITQAIQFQGQSLSGSGDPTTDQFPNDGDWGFYTDTTGPTTYIARNTGGTITKSTLS